MTYKKIKAAALAAIAVAAMTTATLVSCNESRGDTGVETKPVNESLDSLESLDSFESKEVENLDNENLTKAGAAAELPEALQNQKHTLRFDENGEFRILVFGDVQSGPPKPSDETLSGIKSITERESPDLVLFVGDNSIGCTSENVLRNYISAMVESIEENKIPWAHVYGNHDDEGALSRSRQQAVYEEFTYCVSQSGPEEIKGVGNYVLPIYSADASDSAPVFAVWGLDSGGYVTDSGLAGSEAVLDNSMYAGHRNSTYAYMPFTQIQWYFNTSLELEEYAGRRVPGMMYFHIPLQEFYEVSLNPTQTEMVGMKQEAVCAGPLNSGMFTAMIERGDIKAVCCGHDHINDYAGEFCGIKLCYSSNIGYDTYHDSAVMGGRVFVIRESEPDEVETYISYVSGISLRDLTSSADSSALLDFETDAAYSLTGSASVSAVGIDKSSAMTIPANESGGATLTNPLSLSSGRYLRLWIGAEAAPMSAAIVSYTGDSYSAGISDATVYYLPDGESEWKTSGSGETLPAGFTGYIAISCGSLKNPSGAIPQKETAIAGFELTAAESAVSADNIRMVTNYKNFD